MSKISDLSWETNLRSRVTKNSKDKPLIMNHSQHPKKITEFDGKPKQILDDKDVGQI